MNERQERMLSGDVVEFHWLFSICLSQMCSVLCPHLPISVAHKALFEVPPSSQNFCQLAFIWERALGNTGILLEIRIKQKSEYFFPVPSML